MKSQRDAVWRKNAKVNQSHAATLVSKVYKGCFEFLNYLFSLFLFFVFSQTKRKIVQSCDQTKN